MYTFNPTHTPARNLIHSGNIAATRPTLGAWISYGLGTENQNLPGFVAGFSLSSLKASGAPASCLPNIKARISISLRKIPKR